MIITLASKQTELDWLGLCYHRFWSIADWNWQDYNCSIIVIVWIHGRLSRL